MAKSPATKLAFFATLACLVVLWLLARQREDPARAGAARRGATPLPSGSAHQAAPPPAAPDLPSPPPAPPPAPVVEPIAPAAGSLRVRVVDETGLPWGDARVQLARPGSEAVAGVTPDGETRFANLAPGRWYLAVSAGDVRRLRTIPVVPGRDEELCVVIPREGALLTGVVRHREQGPLGHVTVRLRERESNDTLSATTGEAGDYRIELVPPGTYRVSVEGSAELGHQTVGCPDLRVPGTGQIERDLLVGFVSLTGVVRDGRTFLPIAGVRVDLREPGAAGCRTDAEGVYRFFDVPPGMGKLALEAAGYALRFVEAGKIETGRTRTLDVELWQAAVLHLHVTNERGEPVTGRLRLSVRCLRDSTDDHTTTVDADGDGHAVCRSLRPGVYGLSVERDKLRSLRQEFEVCDGENTARFQIPGAAAEEDEAGPKSVRASVTDARTGEPVRGARVRLAAHGKGRVREGFTDARGSFGWGGVAAGKYTLSVAKDGYGFQNTTFELQAGEERRLDLSLAVAATLNLRLTDAGGLAVSGRVYLFVKPAAKGPGTMGSVMLDVGEDGCVTCRQIVPGSYELHFSQDERRATARAALTPGENTLEVRLE